MPRIFGVDDQQNVRAMICMVLCLNRFEVTEAESAKAGLKAFAAESFDAAIIDIFLEDLCGLDLIAAMCERVPNLPAVAVSGMATLDAVARSSDLSSVACLQKPFRPIELIRAIEKARGSVGQAAGTQIAV